MVGPLSISLANYIKSSKALSKWIKPVANWYADFAGYRKLGFKYDDLLVEERPDVQRALNRLTTREAYDRAFRLKRASQASVLHKPLPKELWTKPEDDRRYLKPHVVNVAKEDAERKMWDNVLARRQ